MGIEASVVIDFENSSEDEVSGLISVELDDEHPNNLDDDDNLKSSFGPEEEPIFLIHHDNTIQIIKVECTDGRVYQEQRWSKNNTIVRTRNMDVLFTRYDSEISLSYDNVSDIDVTWYGNIGSVYVVDNKFLPGEEGDEFPCYGRVTYSVYFNEQWRLVPPPLDLEEDETYNIYVVIYVREVPPVPNPYLVEWTT